MMLITGATGNNGQELVRQLIALGQPIRALVRNPEEASGIKGPNVELAVGDFDRTETLDTALRNIDKAFLLTPAAERFVQWQVAFIEAAQRTGVRHLVKFSVLHASPTSPATLLRWHAQTEQHIRAAGIPFTFLRPNMFMQEMLRQADAIKSQAAFYFPFAPDVRLSLVDVRDNAAVAAKVLSERGHEGKIYELTGPVALTFPQIAEKLSSALKRQINYVQVSMDQWKQGFAATGAPGWLIDQVVELYLTFVPANSVVTDTISKLLGRPAKSFDDFVKENANGFG